VLSLIVTMRRETGTFLDENYEEEDASWIVSEDEDEDEG